MRVDVRVLFAEGGPLTYFGELRVALFDRRLGTDTLEHMREISQSEAAAMRGTLKEIASYYNPAAAKDGGQAAALRARETLERLGLFYERDIQTESNPD